MQIETEGNEKEKRKKRKKEKEVEICLRFKMKRSFFVKQHYRYDNSLLTTNRCEYLPCCKGVFYASFDNI